MTSVLFVRLSAMGDVVHGLGAVAALHEVRPEWRLVFVTQTTYVPLLHGFPGLAQVVPFERRGGPRGLWRVRQALRSQRFDHALDLQGNWKSALITRLARAAARFGMAGAWSQEPASRILLGRRVEANGLPHPAKAAWELVRAVAPDAPFRVPRLVAGAAEVADERRAVAAAGVDPDRPFQVVVVTDPRDPRALRPARIDELVQSSPVPVVRLLGPDEAHLPTDNGLPVIRHAAGAVRRLIALGAVVATAGGEVVGPDQGATHVLAAAGAACRVLFGSEDPRRTAPVAAASLVHPAPPACSPCRQRRCRHELGPVCMEFAPESGRRVTMDWDRHQQPSARG